MGSADMEMVKDFQAESKNIIAQAIELLLAVERDPSQTIKLGEYGQLIDRIMGGARSLSLSIGGHLALERIGDFAAICKAVGYKSSQLKDHVDFQNLCVALLLDATEALMGFVDDAKAFLKSTSSLELDERLRISNTLMDRLHWVSAKFGSEYRESVDLAGANSDKMSQDDIDELLKKFGKG